jgi:hypothetical protein
MKYCNNKKDYGCSNTNKNMKMTEMVDERGRFAGYLCQDCVDEATEYAMEWDRQYPLGSDL